MYLYLGFEKDKFPREKMNRNSRQVYTLEWQRLHKRRGFYVTLCGLICVWHVCIDMYMDVDLPVYACVKAAG